MKNIEKDLENVAGGTRDKDKKDNPLTPEEQEAAWKEIFARAKRLREAGTITDEAVIRLDEYGNPKEITTG